MLSALEVGFCHCLFESIGFGEVGFCLLFCLNAHGFQDTNLHFTFFVDLCLNMCLNKVRTRCGFLLQLLIVDVKKNVDLIWLFRSSCGL